MVQCFGVVYYCPCIGGCGGLEFFV